MSEVTKELLELVWGTKSSPGLSDTIFCRWTQGTRAGQGSSSSRSARALGVEQGRLSRSQYPRSTTSPRFHYLGYLALVPNALILHQHPCLVQLTTL